MGECGTPVMMRGPDYVEVRVSWELASCYGVNLAGQNGVWVRVVEVTVPWGTS
jgi:hypothetical protein